LTSLIFISVLFQSLGKEHLAHENDDNN